MSSTLLMSRYIPSRNCLPVVTAGGSDKEDLMVTTIAIPHWWQVALLTSLLLTLPNFVSSTGWLAIAQMGSIAPMQADKCHSFHKTLTKKQIQICRANTEHMESVKQGAQMAILECQHQFRHRRWNCSMVNSMSIFGNVLKLASRETAFVHAISSAGVTHSVTRDCSSGRLEKCGCDGSVKGKSPEGFQWAGCSDNIHYGSLFGKRFVDVYEHRKQLKNAKNMGRKLMNLHNNEAGRKAIERNMRTVCKCHGVSGSCEMKTCWKAMPKFREIGDILKEKFDGSTEVQLLKDKTRSVLQPLNVEHKRQTDEDLVYLETSPDFCSYDNNTDTLGTAGRICNKTSSAIDGCDLLCCGRGFKTRVETRTDRCGCKFHWCCYVKCKECETTVQIHTCL